MALRELFDQVAQGVQEDANLIAARIVQLGGRAEGTAQAVAGRSSLDGYRLATAVGNGHIDALSQTLTNFGRHARYASEQATLLQDADTAAIFTEIGRASTSGSGSSRRASKQAVERGGLHLTLV
jgi:starvation-inducible DNA-binding protein